MRRPTLLPALLLAIGVLSCAATAASAKTFLDVQIGWGDKVRLGRWNPIFVTASDDKTRQVRVEVEVAQGGPTVLRLHQDLTIGPVPTTVALHAPCRVGYGERPSVTLRDGNTGKTLARWPPDGAQVYQSFDTVVQSQHHFIGVCGPNDRLDRMVTASGIAAEHGGLPIDRLPDAVVGYDALDLLVLRRADLNRIDPDRQRAVADWVRAGGCLLVIPPDVPVPADGPLAEILPCRVGQPRDYPLTADQRKRYGLGERYKGLRGFALTPASGAEPLPLLAEPNGETDVLAYGRDVGFGRVVVAPVDVSELDFNDTEGGKTLFKALLAGTGLIDDADPKQNRSYSYGLDAVSQRQGSATGLLEDHLGNVPGAGRFGFSYVAWVVLGMMVLVGPVDWFVLKRLGRQPWTWVTTAGWVGAVTVGALYIGHVFKSGDLHYRTVSLIDQAGGQVVARSTLAGLYSPRTTTYHVDAAPTGVGEDGKPVPTRQPPSGWWDPAAAGEQYYRSSGLKVDTLFHQTLDGNLPDAMTVNVWNLRFLRGETFVPGDPVIRAELRLTGAPDGDATRVEGTVTNLSGLTLTEVRVRVGDRYVSVAAAGAERPHPMTSGGAHPRISPWPVAVDRLPAGATVAVNGALVGPSVVSDDDPAGHPTQFRGATPPAPTGTVSELAPELSGRRSARADEATRSGRYALVYATVADAKPDAVLREPGAIERHEAVVRALVPVRGPDTRPVGDSK
ncbi:MAG: hypothetical protein JWO31_1599 [Phycisphaerales bacterium]|nr:hypothetical protein [Phycisphaerales bacterium]